MMQLNERLATKQKVTPEQRDNLQKIYTNIKDLYECAGETINDIDDVTAKEVVKLLKSYEFQLQENWNFDQDELFHTHWNKIPGCVCPIMDNNERFGHEKITRGDCPWHGFGKTELDDEIVERNITYTEEIYESEIDDICRECWDPDCEGC